MPLLAKMARTPSSPWLAVALSALAAVAGAQELPDAPEPAGGARMPPSAAPASYLEALATWAAPEDIARFIQARFVYDRARAIALADPADAGGERPAIRPPAAMYETVEGVCIDLARFGVETLNRLDASFAARYLMLEFEPVVVDGRRFRRHWIASFRRDGQVWFFADSRRPGHVAGPYDSVADFVADYALHRARSIVSWRETETFLRTPRAIARKSVGTTDE